MLRTFVLINALLLAATLPVLAKSPNRIETSNRTRWPFPAPPALFDVLGDSQAWRGYKRHFISEQGRIIDTANGQISHSEGQGYGMLLAVASGDHETFRRIWLWTRAELMLRTDALLAWRWQPNSRVAVTDLNNATDGDLLIAWALEEAGETWPNEGYRQDARRIATDIGRRAVLWKAKGGPLLLPGAVGFSAAERKSGPIVNLSYWVFPAFPRLATVAPEFEWARLESAGLDLVRLARFGATRLPTEWIAMGGGTPEPAPDVAPNFSYNAIRIPLYLALAGDMNRGDYAPFAELWAQAVGNRLPIVDAETGQNGGWMVETGYAALAVLTQCAAWGAPLPDWFLHPAEGENYYPSTLHMLALIAVHENYSQCIKH